MARPKHSAHPDANQQAIIDGLRWCGFLVIDCSQWAKEFDILVYGPDEYEGHYRWQPFEIKTRRGRLTLAQEIFQREWPGAVYVIRNLDEALICYGRRVAPPIKREQ